MSSDDVLLGLGLVLVLAVSSQLLAARVRIPAIVLLLPAGFIAGAATDVVHPDRLLGDLYQRRDPVRGRAARVAPRRPA